MGGYGSDSSTSCKYHHNFGSIIVCWQVEWAFRLVEICCGCRQHKYQPARLWNVRISNDFKSTKPFEDIEDWESFEEFNAAFVSASHAENPSRVTPELLEKVWRIDNATVKRTLKVTTLISRHDNNTSLSWKFGKMIEFWGTEEYIYSLILTASLWLRKQVSIKHQVPRDLPACNCLYQIRNMFLLCQWRVPDNYQRHCGCL